MWGIGEAANPGPEQKPGLTLGAINPTGILHKGYTLEQIPKRSNFVLGVSESHLTNIGINQFNKELACINKSYNYLAGAPAPYRSKALTSIAGKYVGTGFITPMSCRKLQPSWTEKQWEESRFAMGAFNIGPIWLHGGVCYGHAQRAQAADVMEQTDAILAIATHRLVYQTRGYRFICGDFNQDYNVLPQTHIWESMGWKEVQCLQKQHHGTPEQPTCKSKTRKDFIYVSPELARLFDEASVTNHIYPDHGVLLANFKIPTLGDPINLWRKPKKFR